MSKKLNLAEATKAREAFLAGPNTQKEVQMDIPQYVRTSVRPLPLPTRKHYTFSLDIALHQRLRVAAAIQGRDMRDLIEDALRAHLGPAEPEPGQ